MNNIFECRPFRGSPGHRTFRTGVYTPAWGMPSFQDWGITHPQISHN